MKTVLLQVLLILSFASAGAQTNCKVKTAYAFYTVSVPGMQMADENGNPIPPKADINRFIYIEWCGTKKPVIESVLYNNKPLSATLIAVEGDSVILGSNFSNNPDFKIMSKKDNKLWKIELQPVEGNSMPGLPCKNIIIKTKGANAASCEFKVAKETELMTLPRY
jgi:hypothetical protein